MRAIVMAGYGSTDVLQLRDEQKPSPKPNEVLVKIYAASVTAADGMMRTGKPYYGRLFIGLTKPKNPIPGTGFAGVVEAVGDDVKQFAVGDRVFGETTIGFSTYAEHVCISEDGILDNIPNNLSFQEAAVVCDGALTSMNFLKEVAQLKSGQKVLINGASGGLGTAAVQIAKHLGAEVTGVSSTRNIELVRSLGADHVIDYTKEDFTQSGKTFDVIFDTVGKSSFPQCKKVLTENGVYISPVLKIPLLLQMLRASLLGKKKAKFSATGLLPHPILKKLLKQVVALIEAGHLNLVMDKEFELEQAAEAQNYVDGGHKRGNVVLRIASQSVK